MYANEFETKEKQKLSEIKNYLQHIQNMDPQSMDHSMDPFMDPVNGVPLWNHKWNLKWKSVNQ